MMQSVEPIRKMRPLPPGRAHMRYLNLRTAPAFEASGTGLGSYQCSGCDAILLAGIKVETARGLALKCPQCGAVSVV